MGYRSEVAIKCEPAAYQMLIAATKGTYYEPDHIYKYEYEHFPECVEYTLHWDWVKWYGDEVSEIEHTLDYLRENYNEENGYGFFLTRIGEEDGDIEHDYNNPELYLGVIIKMDFDYNCVIK